MIAFFQGGYIFFRMTLRELFESHGITQQSLVDRLSMKRQYAFMLWHGQRKLGAKLAKQISDEYGIPVTDLLYPESAEPRKPKP